jgi:hypothetical protein
MVEASPLVDRHIELSSAKAKFNLAMAQNNALETIMLNGGTEKSHSQALSCEPTNKPLSDGSWLWGLRFSISHSNGDGAEIGTSAHEDIDRYLPIAHFTPKTNVVVPHPELIEALEFERIDPTESTLQGITMTWEESMNALVNDLRGKIIYAEDYSVAVLGPDYVPPTDYI